MNRRVVAVALLLGFVMLWPATRPPQPVPAGADLYSHLTVARHLARGDGFLCDVAYPLSAAFAWGCELPQPLLHRQPGMAVLLTAPYLAAGGDPARTLRGVWWLQVLVLGLAAALGLRGLRRRGAAAAAPAWLLLLATCPLLVLAVHWGWSEVVCGTWLLAAWLRWRERRGHAGRRSLLIDGALAGGLALIRLDLVWVPVLWWLLPTLARSAGGAGRWRRLARGLAWFALGAALVTAPWFIRTARVAGSPFFNLQSYAVELDLSTEWWNYDQLRGLTPSPLASNLLANAGPALVKVRHGVRFFAETLGQWLPWSIWLAAGALWWRSTRRRRRRGRPWPTALGLPAALAVTLALLCLEYALFSQEVRHLLVLLPVLSWEIARQADAAAATWSRLRDGRRRAVALLLVVGAAVLVTPTGIGGEVAQVQTARVEAAPLAALVRTAADLPAGPVFTDNAAVLWYGDRAGIWSPRDAAVEASLRTRVRGMRHAPWLRLTPLTSQ